MKINVALILLAVLFGCNTKESEENIVSCDDVGEMTLPEAIIEGVPAYNETTVN